MATRITTRHDLISELRRSNPSLDVGNLMLVPDAPVTLDTPDAYNVANTKHVVEMLARVLHELSSRCAAPADTIRTLFRNVTSEGTAAGYLAQLQGYDWLLDQGTTFVPEISHAQTLRGRNIDLDGKADVLGRPIFFDIKSFGFEPDFRAAFRNLLEKKLPGSTITIDGPGNHGADIINAEAFGKLKQHLSGLASNNRITIAALNWTVTKRKQEGVSTAEHEYNPPEFIRQNRWVPLRFASQFTTDAAYVLMFVLPDGLGSTPITSNTLGFAEQVIDGLAAHLFGPARTDAGAAQQHDPSLAPSVTIAQAVSRLSAIALYSPQARFAKAHFNGQAASPLSSAELQKFAPKCPVVAHP